MANGPKSRYSASVGFSRALAPSELLDMSTWFSNSTAEALLPRTGIRLQTRAALSRVFLSCHVLGSPLSTSSSRCTLRCQATSDLASTSSRA